jgi:phospholipid-binding lipoprotein MlaA
MNRRLAFIFLLCLFGAACAGKKAPQPSLNENAVYQDENAVYDEYDDDDYYDFSMDGPAEPDGLEKINRGVFAFNDGLITHVATPIHNVYTGLFPRQFRNGFSNFYRNLKYPVRLVNSLLQFKLDKVGKETASFVLNTLFGMAGLFNVAGGVPALECSPEDFGQTLAFYGVGHGSYLVLPILGSSSLRDTPGLIADALLNPLTWVQPQGLSYGLTAHDKINTVSGVLPAYQTLKADSLDHYTSIKDVYFQHRDSLEKK